MAVFVLVHGSWAGGWQWQPIRRLLEAKGHRVLAPSLTGLADRFHLATEETGLSTHIEDVARLIEWERMEDVVLVGHSYGGMVITGVASRVAGQLRRLVYVDAFFPKAGECAWDLLPWQRDAFQMLRLEDRPWLVRPVETKAFFPELGDVDDSRLTPMPIKTHEEPLPQGEPGGIAGTFIHCIARPSYFDDVAKRAGEAGMTVKTLDAGHMVILTHPQEVADILLAAVEERP
ncbi:alpha/beta hydrolase [Agrobacterium tumefaciens]|uniref:alpha/beta fold hydrolase n=1 Tax=Agrobacterium tumefaciens TaxID=358 RepID=UPI0015717F55|nr:alpha/beta hydrolase [Agrobacterium tumefaciens]